MVIPITAFKKASKSKSTVSGTVWSTVGKVAGEMEEVNCAITLTVFLLIDYCPNLGKQGTFH